ncbi:MAG: D-alanyl-D-alanine carboxypeptidase [Clostridiales bacterium]|nr:D-alanyl-D-alanine carboxypeptidase [Clostridiales bacterium]
MKKRFIAIFLLFVVILGGCQKSSDNFLSYKDYVTTSKNNLGINLSENGFFADNLVIITEEEHSTNDDLISSKAAFLCNVTNNEALYSKNIYEQLYPASLTKLMTALVVLKRGELTDTVTISYNASHIQEPGAKVCGFKEGDTIKLEALLNCLLIYSGNDAAIAIAEHIGGSEEEFVKTMNLEAKKIGAVHTNFVNSHGLHDDNHYSTAYDVYLIFNELVKYDTFLNIISLDSYTANYLDIDKNNKDLTFKTTNRYLTEQEEAPEGIFIIGGKTGITFKAGNCLILFFKDNNNNQYINVALKAENNSKLYSDMDTLFSLVLEDN